ncbi:hypothetical protein NHG29_01330 [Aerococcaceae bacterium NML160702]|nr:hypothetical protein [Aerococcaceae bacterium NML190073]MCW6681508.1 hypothetical protein [Aerococcaceae bacterium NML160702]
MKIRIITPIICMLFCFAFNAYAEQTFSNDVEYALERTERNFKNMNTYIENLENKDEFARQGFALAISSRIQHFIKKGYESDIKDFEESLEFSGKYKKEFEKEIKSLKDELATIEKTISDTVAILRKEIKLNKEDEKVQLANNFRDIKIAFAKAVGKSSEEEASIIKFIDELE